MSAILQYIDLLWFLQHFIQLGHPLNIKLNTSKTKILTSLTATSPLPFLSPDNKCYLTQALAFLNGNPKVHEGVCLLGQPLGSQSFVACFLMDKANAFAKIALKQLTNHITSKQTQGTIFQNCAILSITHLLAVNVFHHADLTTPANPFLWHSAFTDTITMTTELFICKLTQQNQLPPESCHLLALPIPLGGCGF